MRRNLLLLILIQRKDRLNLLKRTKGSISALFFLWITHAVCDFYSGGKTLSSEDVNYSNIPSLEHSFVLSRSTRLSFYVQVYIPSLISSNVFPFLYKHSYMRMVESGRGGEVYIHLQRMGKRKGFVGRTFLNEVQYFWYQYLRMLASTCLAN